MIETVEELIEVYSLDKEIDDANPVYKDFAVNMFGIYCLLRGRVFNLPLPKDEVKPTDLSVTENNPTETKPIEAKPIEAKPIEDKQIEDKPVENKVVKKAKNVQKSSNYDNKPAAKVNEIPDLSNINLENETAKIISAINERLNKQVASINIVQNAYVDGNKVNTGEEDDEENSGSNGGSAINTVNINFAGNDCNQPMVNQPVKKKIIENEQSSNDNTDKSQEEPNRPILIKSAEDFNLLCSILKLIFMVAAIAGVLILCSVL